MDKQTWVGKIFITSWCQNTTYEPPRDTTNKMACAPSEDSDQPGHPPSLIRVFAVRMKKARVFSYPLSAKRRLGSDWADAQADLSLRWAHSHFVGFVMRWLIFAVLLLKLSYRRSAAKWCQTENQLKQKHGLSCSVFSSSNVINITENLPFYM